MEARTLDDYLQEQIEKRLRDRWIECDRIALPNSQLRRQADGTLPGDRRIDHEAGQI